MRTLRHPIIASTLAGTALALAGCQAGHGKYTGEFKEQAEARMAQVRAGTSWDMARQMFLAGDLEKAERIVDQAISIAPDVPKSHVLRGRIMLEQGAIDEAIAAFNRAIELDPESADAYYYSGIIHERFARSNEALDMFLAAVDADPTNPQYVIAAAEMFIQEQDLEGARALLEEGMIRFDHNAGIRQTLGHIAMMQDDPAAAAEAFGEACLLAPDDMALVEDLARAQLAQGDFAEAEYSLSQLLRKDDVADRRDLRHMQARCLFELDRPVEARAIYLELTQDARGQADFDAWLGLGETAIKLRDQGRLRDAASRLIAIDRTRPEGYMLMAILQRQRGDLDKAVQTLDRAVELSAANAEPALLQAIVYDELGDRAAAARSAQIALEIDPDNLRARGMLGSFSARLAEVPIDE